MRLIFIKILLITSLALILPGCSSLGDIFSGTAASDEKDEYVDWNADKFRTEAKAAIDTQAYEKAIKIYTALESRYPFGKDSAQTQLDIAYAYYKNGQSEEAIGAADRFIKINPRNPSVDYAYYLKGLVNYNKDIGFIDRFLPTDPSQRDPGSARSALQTFEELIRRFPNSKYVEDAKLRSIALRNNIAMYEVHVARYYLKRRSYIAAANRAANVIKNYQRTPAVPFAMQAMIEAYTKLGMDDLAKDATRIYEMNFPKGPPVAEHSNSTFSHQVWDFIGLEK